jgi:glycosidase
VAFGLAVTLPGIPVVFAGDEFGLVGVDGEASRTPIPWSGHVSIQLHTDPAVSTGSTNAVQAHPTRAA